MLPEKLPELSAREMRTLAFIHHFTKETGRAPSIHALSYVDNDLDQPLCLTYVSNIRRRLRDHGVIGFVKYRRRVTATSVTQLGRRVLQQHPSDADEWSFIEMSKTYGSDEAVVRHIEDALREKARLKKLAQYKDFLRMQRSVISSLKVLEAELAGYEGLPNKLLEMIELSRGLVRLWSIPEAPTGHES